MSAAAEELDLTRPGKLYCKAEWERETTFYLVIPQKSYTKNSLTLKPHIDPKDELMRPWTVSAEQAKKDKEDMAYCDLAESGRAQEIMDTLAQRYERGEPKVETVRGVYLAKAAQGNDPQPQVAEIKDFKLIPIPGIFLKDTADKPPLQTYVTVPTFKAGVKNFTVELKTTGLVTDVEISCEPACDISVEPGGAKGKGKVTAKTDETKKYTISVAVPFTMREEHTTVSHPFTWHGYDCWYRAAYTETQAREIWTGADVTLRVAGTGKYKNIVKSVRLRAENWASGWLSRTPPPPLRHNHC
jgi:hypothetical protein